MGFARLAMKMVGTSNMDLGALPQIVNYKFSERRWTLYRVAYHIDRGCSLFCELSTAHWVVNLSGV